MFVDTHCHIHEPNYVNAEAAYVRALDANVIKMICVGTDIPSSRQALDFAMSHESAWASIGVHPHDTKDGYEAIFNLVAASPAKLVAIGEIGLDYFYTHSPRDIQIRALEMQLQLAKDLDLPVVFHVREAFDDFWPIYQNFAGLRGELHSFTDSIQNLERGLSEGLYVGVNGISTFTKDTQQQAMFQAIPLEKMLLETDAPFLTPAPNRGKVNEPAFVRNVAEYHAHQRGVELEHLARVTSANASTLFSLS